MSVSDNELLRQYIGNGSEQAFAELVQRHFDLVYSTALRRVAGDGELARDVSQIVFMDLARKARALAKRASVAGWLYTSTLFAAANSVRGEVRRRAREQEAVTMQQSDNAPAIDWHQLQPVLDQAMQQLTECDREIILLRFFERSDYRTVSATLGISEDAARKRVDRALDKLRGLVGGQGFAPTTATLAALIGTYAVVPAPAGLAGPMTGAALAAVGSGTALSIGNLIMTTQAKMLAATAVAVVGLTAPNILQFKAIQRLKAENAALKTQKAAIAKLRADYNRLAQSGVDSDQLDQLKKDHSELLRLRGEVGRLRGQLRSNPPSTPTTNQEANAAKPAASPEPVTRHTAFGHAVLGQGQSYVLGGWEVHPGKRTLVFVSPSAPPEYGENQILIETRIVEMSESALAEAGLQGLKRGSENQSLSDILTREQTDALWKTLPQTPGVEFLTAPRITTADGRQAQVRVQSQMPFVNSSGESTTVAVGPCINIVPHLSADRTTVDMTVYATLSVPNSENAPPNSGPQPAAGQE